ncbi:MAG: dihydropteroate synthase [Nitrospinae bacterium]|nr:dihydropteroate synthase [Nitrospinota bacterium]
MREGLRFTHEKRAPAPAVKCRGRELDFDRVRIMGVLNATPDSFSDGGKFFDSAIALEQIARMAEEGADVIDIGGESTRPGSSGVNEAEEIRRIIPILERMDMNGGPLVSVDTSKAGVARAALDAGVHVINDVTGLRDPEMRAVIAESGAAAIAMHMKGEPRTMQKNPEYEDLMGELSRFLGECARRAEREGIASVLVDPGVGFGKSWDHNLEILRRMGELRDLGYPLVVGVSRKSFIGAITGVEAAGERLIGSKVAEAFAVVGGADMIRTHDVGVAVEAVRMGEAIRRGRVDPCA